MDLHDINSQEIFSKKLRAGRRTYFFDVRSTKAEDYYLTITESKKHTNEDGSSYFKKHKIFLYKEDFVEFKEMLDEVTKFIIEEKGVEVISDYEAKDSSELPDKLSTPESDIAKDSEYTSIEFEDI